MGSKILTNKIPHLVLLVLVMERFYIYIWPEPPALHVRHVATNTCPSTVGGDNDPTIRLANLSQLFISLTHCNKIKVRNCSKPWSWLSLWSLRVFIPHLLFSFLPHHLLIWTHFLIVCCYTNYLSTLIISWIQTWPCLLLFSPLKLVSLPRYSFLLGNLHLLCFSFHLCNLDLSYLKQFFIFFFFVFF